MTDDTFSTMNTEDDQDGWCSYRLQTLDIQAILIAYEQK